MVYLHRFLKALARTDTGITSFGVDPVGREIQRDVSLTTGINVLFCHCIEKKWSYLVHFRLLRMTLL